MTAERSTPLGMYFNARKRKGRFFEMMHNWPSANVQVLRFPSLAWKEHPVLVADTPDTGLVACLTHCRPP